MFGTLEKRNSGIMSKEILLGFKPNIPAFQYSKIPGLGHHFIHQEGEK